MSRRALKGVGAALILLLAAGIWGISHLAPRDIGNAPRPSSTAAQPTAAGTSPSTRPEPDAPPPYSRTAQFGPAWSDVDRNGCDTRNDILGRDLTDLLFKPGTRGCVVLAGTLNDIYSGKTVRFTRGQGTSEKVQIDHIVALKWAWDHGAWRWTQQERLEFANDPANLVAVSQEANAAKSDKAPSEWLPEDAAGRCRFAQAWTDVTGKYDLDVPDAEHSAIAAAIEKCPSLSHG